MNGNHTTSYLHGLRRAGEALSGFNRNSLLPDHKREDKEMQAAEHRGRVGAPPRVGFNSVIQNAAMTLRSFVETKFIPEHVQHKTIAGRTHYQAMLKHLIRPETV